MPIPKLDESQFRQPTAGPPAAARGPCYRNRQRAAAGKMIQPNTRQNPVAAGGGGKMTVNKDDGPLNAVTVGGPSAELQERLEATDKGSFVVIDAASGDYEVDPNPTVAKRRLKARRPGITTFTKRIGRPEFYKLVSVR